MSVRVGQLPLLRRAETRPNVLLTPMFAEKRPGFVEDQKLVDSLSPMWRLSALTLRELERYIALDIVGSYHQSIHSSLGRPPIAV